MNINSYNMNFEQKVKSMSAHDIIMAMVEGLKNPSIGIEMQSYGICKDNICYGCAATVTVMNIADVTFNESTIKQDKHCKAVGSSFGFLASFEDAIDMLRRGNVKLYNIIAKHNGFATIKQWHIPILQKKIILPILNTEDYMYNLRFYEALAKRQKNWI